MAVQAQYPSNVFLLNRNEQEMNNTIDNDLFNQSQMYFNNNRGGEGSTRKRTRETSFGVGNNRGIGIDLFSLQPQQPHQTTLINLSELHNQQHQPNLVSTGLHLATQEQSSKQITLLSDEITLQLKQQTSEIDQFLQVQGEQLRRTLAQTRQTHYHSLVNAISESESAKRLSEKEAEMQKAVKRNRELEQRASQIRVEAQVWQNKARKNEAIAVSLQGELQKAIMSLGAQNREEEIVAECSGAEDAESAHVDPRRESCELTRMSCKACKRGVASVVLLPCRHLCLCTNCNGEVDTCPVCFVYRSASLEVYLS